MLILRPRTRSSTATRTGSNRVSGSGLPRSRLDRRARWAQTPENFGDEPIRNRTRAPESHETSPTAGALLQRPFVCATKSIASSSPSSPALFAADSQPKPITFALRSPARSTGKSATNTRSRSAGSTIANCIDTAMRPHGGPQSTSTRCWRRSRLFELTQNSPLILAKPASARQYARACRNKPLRPVLACLPDPSPRGNPLARQLGAAATALCGMVSSPARQKLRRHQCSCDRPLHGVS
jgi:hypothetical protein